MIRTFQDLEKEARRIVTGRRYALLMERHFHAPQYHSYSLLRHMRYVVRAAVRIRQESGVDVLAAALYHDVGKFACVMERDVSDPEKFAGHEARSAEIAAADGLPPAAVLAIRNHDAAYRKDVGFDPVAFTALAAHDPEHLQQLVGLCAADAAGKGFLAPGAHKQRPKIAQLLFSVAATRLDDVRFARIVLDAADRWDVTEQ